MRMEGWCVPPLSSLINNLTKKEKNMFLENELRDTWTNMGGNFYNQVGNNVAVGTGGIGPGAPTGTGVISGSTGFTPCSATMNQCPCSYGGCMDSSFMEFDANATCDDGSCATPIVMGCTSSGASNYNSSANVDDGSCSYPVLGCTDTTASNYNPSATQDDGGCAYPGCSDPNAVNYNPNANYDCSGNAITGGGSSASNTGGGGAAQTGGSAGYAKFGGEYSNMGGCGTYSNFNQQGFGGFNDQMWFND
jgi:hypothetical protein